MTSETNASNPMYSFPRDSARSNNYIFSDEIKLFEPLIIPPLEFGDNYNIDISDYVERHKAKEDAQSKGGANQLKRDILYMSYSQAIRLLRSKYPTLEVSCVVNPLTGGYVFEDLDRRTYFVRAYVHDGYRRSEAFYSPILSMSGQGIHPDDVKSDYKSGKPKLNSVGQAIYTIDGAAINKAIYRAYVKAIALVTGIGLKLWTGDDLSEEVHEAKLALITNVRKLAEQLNKLTGQTYAEVNDLDYTTPEGEVKRLGRTLQQALLEAKSPTKSLASSTTVEVSATNEVELVD